MYSLFTRPNREDRTRGKMRQSKFSKILLSNKFIDILCEYLPDDTPNKTFDEISEKLVDEVREHLIANMDTFVENVLE